LDSDGAGEQPDAGNDNGDKEQGNPQRYSYPFLLLGPTALLRFFLALRRLRLRLSRLW